MSNRLRLRGDFWRPQWENPFKGYAINFIKQNQFKCDPTTNSFQDLLQDCYIVFHRVVETYPRVREPQHLMALFKTALFNEFANKARYKQHKDAAEYHPPKDVAEFYAERIGELSNAGYLNALLNEAPEELKLVLDVLVNNRIKPRLRIRKRHMQIRQNANGDVRDYLKKLGVAISDPLGDLSKLLQSN